ncbi:MAG: phosphoribosyl-ATP diphosphatase [Methanoregula sp.]|nr:phosphoribosyl-ATP diphosphatase [Methanoregula sp.]
MSSTQKEPLDCRMLGELWEVICNRAAHPDVKSYTSRLLNDPKGIDKVLEKVGEESTEFILAVKNGVPRRTAEEAADLFFHLFVALRAADVDLKEVIAELERRRK